MVVSLNSCEKWLVCILNCASIKMLCCSVRKHHLSIWFKISFGLEALFDTNLLMTCFIYVIVTLSFVEIAFE